MIRDVMDVNYMLNVIFFNDSINVNLVKCFMGVCCCLRSTLCCKVCSKNNPYLLKPHFDVVMIKLNSIFVKYLTYFYAERSKQGLQYTI